MNCPHCGKPINAAAMLGSISTPAKAQAARENAKLGGWPKGKKRGKYKCSKCGKKFPTVEKCLIHKITCGVARRRNDQAHRSAGEKATT